MTVAIVVGAVVGLALGIVVSVATDLPLMPELGLVLGGLVGWVSQRERG
jgi:NAD/NADP transhydrogenase beta subunit